MRTYCTTLIAALLIVGTGIVEALVFGGRELRIEVTKSKDSTYVFDVVNLKTLKTAKETAKWCFSLHEKNREKPAEFRYSNTARLQFSEDFSEEEMMTIWATFMMEKVYVEVVSVSKDGRIVPFEGMDDRKAGQALVLRVLGLSEEEIKKTQEAEERAKKETKSPTRR